MPEPPKHTSRDVRDLELLNSVTGSVAACANISRKLDIPSRTSAACLSGPLSLIISGFSSMSQSYTNVRSLLQGRELLWSQNVSFSIRFTQERCQQIATELSTTLGQYGEWDILAADGSYHRLNMLAKNLEVLKAHHDLLFKILSLGSVLLRKPAEHESPASITISAFSEEWTFQFTAAQWVDHEALQERQRIAYVAAQEMDRWSRDYASSFGLVQETLRSMKERWKELLDYQIPEESSRAQGFLVSSLEELPDVEDDTSTQSTMGIMTPTIDWSDSGSDTTEVGRAPTVTRHSLQRCGYATASFLRLLEAVQPRFPIPSLNAENIRRLYKAYYEWTDQCDQRLNAPAPPYQHHPLRKAVITADDTRYCIVEMRGFLTKIRDIDESLGQLPSSTLVEITDIEAMHKDFKEVSLSLLDILSVPEPLRGNYPRTDSARSQASVQAPAPESPKPVMPGEKKDKTRVDKALELLINSMETTPTEKDMMKLVFHWTTLNECNGFTRADVMTLN